MESHCEGVIYVERVMSAMWIMMRRCSCERDDVCRWATMSVLWCENALAMMYVL